MSEAPGIAIVDTPGVGARDGEDDYRMAFDQVPAADLILWVASNNSVQEDTARALRTLGVMGKPMVVVLNCRWDLDHPVKRLDFLEDPDVAFRDAQGDINAIERQLAQAGATSVQVLALHANAAFLSTEDPNDPASPDLRECSQVDALYSVLLREREQRAEQRRLIRTVDQVRGPATEYVAALAEAADGLSTMTHASRDMSNDLHARLSRDVDRFSDLLDVRLRELVEKRRTWHTTVDPGKDIEKKWSAELRTLQSEVDAAVEESQRELTRALKETSRRVVSDWESLPLSAFRLGRLTGFGSVWKNRLGRAAIGIGGGLGGLWANAAVGAKVGAALGVEGGPLMLVTGAVGAVAAVALSIAAKPLKDRVDSLFHGKAAVLRKRQEELRRKIHPVLDEMQSALLAKRQSTSAQQTQALVDAFAVVGEALKSQEDLHASWLAALAMLQEDLNALDASTAGALLSLNGRHRLAGQVVRAMRSPGVGLAVEFTKEGFSEAALFPPVDTVERILPAGPCHTAVPAGQALPVAMGLCHGRIRVKTLGQHSADLLLLDDEVPSGIADAWGDLLSAFTHSAITVLPRSTHDYAPPPRRRP